MNLEDLEICAFCRSKPSRGEEFIEINQNAVDFDGNIVDFCDIIDSLLRIKPKNKLSSLMCERCKDLLIQFYIFAENARVNNNNFSTNDTLDKCRQYIDSVTDESVFCVRYNKCLVLGPESKRKLVESLPFLVYDSESKEELQLSEKCGEENDEEYAEEVNSPRTFNFDSQSIDIEEVEMLHETEEMADEDSPSLSQDTSHFPAGEVTSSKRYVKLFCSQCSYQFTKHSHFVAHTNGHRLFDHLARHMNFPKCETCSIMLVDDDSANIHYAGHETGKLIEAIASEGFFLKFGIRRGDQEDFDEEGTVKCGHCLRRFKSDADCTKHLLIFHAKVLVCPRDQREFNGNQAFSVHMRNNHPELFPDTKFRCSVCAREFESLYEKLAHMRSCGDKKFACDHCDKSFSRRCHLMKHLRQVSGELSVECEVCRKVCRDKHDYRIHFRSHSSEKLFKCSLCPKAYKTSSARAAHLQAHMEIIVCVFCEAQFKSRRTMQKHVKTKHEPE